ncbi:hypothetical protein F5Y14DRAFT_427181 [Nemania sp. NC0429]|nr:hypothetical protein F5Y14DRAFT_427181 [Nemania sp. NC0429]
MSNMSNSAHATTQADTSDDGEGWTKVVYKKRPPPKENAGPAAEPQGGEQQKTNRLSDTERQRRLKLKLCLYCGSAGHKKYDCPGGARDASAAEPQPVEQQNPNKLSDTERQRRLTLGLCLYCGQAGHKKHDCPVGQAKALRSQHRGPPTPLSLNQSPQSARSQTTYASVTASPTRAASQHTPPPEGPVDYYPVQFTVKTKAPKKRASGGNLAKGNGTQEKQ